jgi:uncharacterized membrane protein YczE
LPGYGLHLMSGPTLARIALIVVLGILAADSLRKNPISPTELQRRLPRCVFGLALFGTGIAFQFAAGLGTGPWDVLHGGLATITGWKVGLVLNLVGIAILPLWFPLKQRIGLGTVLNTLEIGLVLDLVRPHISQPDAMAVRVLYSIIGVVIIALGSGFYIGSGLGAGPRDGIMMGLKRLGLSVRAARTVVEITTLVIGLLLGGKAGVGTVLFLLGIGPCVQFFLERLTLPPIIQTGTTSSRA